MDDESLEIARENLMDYNSSDSFDSPVTPPNSSERIIIRGRGREILNNNLAYENHRTCCHRCGNLRRHNVLCSECPYTFCARCSNKMLQEHGFDIFKNGCPVCKHLCCCGPNKSVNCPRMFHCYKKCPKTKALKEIDQNSYSAMESPLDDTERSTESHALDVLRFPSNNSHSRSTNPYSSNSSISSSFTSNSSATTLYPSTFSPTTNHQGLCPPLGKLLLQGSEERHEAPAMLPLFTPITPTSSSSEKEKNNTQPRQTATRNFRKGNILKNSLPHIDQAYYLTSTVDDECGKKLDNIPILNISDRKRQRATITSTAATAATNTTQYYYSDMDSKNMPNNKHPRIHHSITTATTATTGSSHEPVDINPQHQHQHQHTHSSPSFDLSDTFLDDDFDFLDTLTSHHEIVESSKMMHDIASTTEDNITVYSTPSPLPHYHYDNHHPRKKELIMNNNEKTEYDNQSNNSLPLNSESIFGEDHYENNQQQHEQQKDNDNIHSPTSNYHYSTSTATTSSTNNKPLHPFLNQSNLIVTTTEDSRTEKITPLSTLSDPDSQIWKNNFLDPSFLSPLKSIDMLNLRSDFMFASSDGSLISNDNFLSDDDSVSWERNKDDSDVVSS